jgi:hypothetical protein
LKKLKELIIGPESAEFCMGLRGFGERLFFKRKMSVQIDLRGFRGLVP